MRRRFDCNVCGRTLRARLEATIVYHPCLTLEQRRRIRPRPALTPIEYRRRQAQLGALEDSPTLDLILRLNGREEVRV